MLRFVAYRGLRKPTHADFIRAVVAVAQVDGLESQQQLVRALVAADQPAVESGALVACNGALLMPHVPYLPGRPSHCIYMHDRSSFRCCVQSQVIQGLLHTITLSPVMNRSLCELRSPVFFSQPRTLFPFTPTFCFEHRFLMKTVLPGGRCGVCVATFTPAGEHFIPLLVKEVMDYMTWLRQPGQLPCDVLERPLLLATLSMGSNDGSDFGNGLSTGLLALGAVMEGEADGELFI